MTESSLVDLSESRREHLLQGFGRFGFDGVDRIVRRRSLRPCRVPAPVELPERLALVGDDGRYHLHLDGELACASRRSADGGWLHVQGVTLGRRSEDRRVVTWSVTLLEAEAKPEQVRRQHRCPLGDGNSWPPVHDLATPKGRIRAAIAQHAGSLRCQACSARLGQAIDHDCSTGLVRGLLCNSCNWSVDLCPHASGCRWADYLNDPPAAELGLLYPGYARRAGR